MSDPKHMDIVRRAYEIWQRSGEPEGKDEEFYYQAEEELRKEFKGGDPQHKSEPGHFLPQKVNRGDQ